MRYYEVMNMEYRILAGDCIARMQMMDKHSIDDIITDPPYEINFMNSGWDNSGVAYNPKTWEAAHRVLKPNGLLVVFGATRTHHRIAHAIERAGFEIIEIIGWTYSTGFPKNHNISKAIDKRGGEDISWFGTWLRNWREENNIKQKDVAKLFPSKQKYAGKAAIGGFTGCVGNWESGYSIPTNEQFNLICKTFNLPINSLEEAKREAVGKQKYGKRSQEGVMNSNTCGLTQEMVDITVAATTPAKQWEGWGTALKPAWEPIIIARKKGSNRTVKNNNRFIHAVKASKKERNRGLEDFEDKKKYNDFGLKDRIENGETTNSCTNKEASHTKNDHPTVKPLKLMKILVDEYSEKDGTVFDPFVGSGTTGMACVLSDRDFIGCELTEDYLPLIKARIEAVKTDKEGWI